MWSVHLALVRRAAHRRTVSLWRQVVRLGLAVDPVVVIAGLSNDYADYTTTYDEYQEQRYRAAAHYATTHPPTRAYVWNVPDGLG
jgi:hypothetical protein